MLCDGPDEGWESGTGIPAVVSPDRAIHGLLVMKHGEYETVAGFLLANMGRIPKEGDYFLHNGYHLEVIAMKGLKVQHVKISKVPATTEGSKA